MNNETLNKDLPGKGGEIFHIELNKNNSPFIDNDWEETTVDLGDIVSNQPATAIFKYIGKLGIKAMAAGCGSCTTLSVISKDPYTIKADYTPRELSRNDLANDMRFYDSVKTITITYTDKTTQVLKIKARVYNELEK